MIEKAFLLTVIAVAIVGVLYLAIRQRRPSAPYVIGQQVADAQRNEQVRLASGNTQPSPLPSGRYTSQPGEWGLLNPGPSDLDTQLRKSCETFRNLSQHERNVFTSAISMDEFYKLIAFAKRTAVFGLRERDVALLRDGLTALAMIEAKRTDFRDILSALALLYHTASRIGAAPDALLREAAQIAEPEVARLIIGFADRDSQHKNLRDSWGYLEVETAFGKGFARWGFGPFTPKGDLLTVAMKVASVIDADSYETDSVELATELPDVWLRPSEIGLVQKARAKVHAGATVSAQLQIEKHPDASSQQFTVFIVETDSAESADALLKLSQLKEPGDYCRLGVAADRIFCLVIARSFVQGVASFERKDSLNRFLKPIQSAISQTAP